MDNLLSNLKIKVSDGLFQIDPFTSKLGKMYRVGAASGADRDLPLILGLNIAPHVPCREPK